MGSNPSRKIPLLGIAHPIEGKTISGTEIRDLRGEVMVICGLIMYFCKNMGKRPCFG